MMRLSSLRSFGSLVLLIVVVGISVGTFVQSSFTSAFVPKSGSISGSKIKLSSSSSSMLFKKYYVRELILLRMSSDNDDNNIKSQRLRDLGYSNDEIERSTSTRKQPEPQKQQKVRVDMLDNNIDATSITAIGFALITFNFFVLANMGDGGIGGMVAYIINSF